MTELAKALDMMRTAQYLQQQASVRAVHCVRHLGFLDRDTAKDLAKARQRIAVAHAVLAYVAGISANDEFIPKGLA